jgi:hypothetical protein
MSLKDRVGYCGGKTKLLHPNCSVTANVGISAFAMPMMRLLVFYIVMRGQF